jgi:hypothetical protein
LRCRESSPGVQLCRRDPIGDVEQFRKFLFNPSPDRWSNEPGPADTLRLGQHLLRLRITDR